MAKEWYLLTPPYNQLSGYEDEALGDFTEVLDSSIATDVELCNYDLSIVKPIRAIIQNNLQDTKLQSLTRQILVPIGTCKAGMYIKYKNRYWLIVGLVDDNTMYEKAVLALCNWLLTWINTDGKIIQRWASVTSASQHNNGETGMQFYVVRSDQLMIAIPDDDESILIEDGCRFIIDKRCLVYEKTIGDDVMCDTNYKLISYQLTRSDSVIYNYGDSGHSGFIATQDEQHEEDGFYRVDGKGYWLCQAPIKINDKKPLLLCDILAESEIIYNGLEPAIFTAEFFDSTGKLIQIEPQWEINCDFSDKLEVTYIDNYISISVNDAKLINKSFELFLSGDGYEKTSKTIAIKAFI